MKKERHDESTSQNDYTHLTEQHRNNERSWNHQNSSNQLSTSPNQCSNVETNLRSFDHATHSLSTSPNQSSYRQRSMNDNSTHSNGELCDKIRHEIRHFTEELKEKFIKKRLGRKSTNSSSDQEEDQRKCVTRIKINTSDELDFLNLSNSNLVAGLSTSNLSSLNHQASQNSLVESRSPFINRALPPLPGKEFSCARNSYDKASNLSEQFNQFNDLKSKFGENFQMFNETKDDSDEDEESELNVTNCFKIYRDKDVKKTSKIKNLRNHLLPSAKKYSHPPPHLHSRLNTRVQQFDYDDEEDENNGNQTNTQITSPSSLINLNSNLIHHSGTSHKSDNDTRNDESKNEYSSQIAKQSADEQKRRMMDYAESIEKVKDQPWYFGPLSGEKAEKLLEKEPNGSFIVRDSSDENYIFSLTFKLNTDIIHVRIEHDQGSFSFGALQKFSSSTIVDFIHEIVEYSRSGRYLFFLHRLPVIGPMRVQLLNPVSRFRNIQSLKHLSRFIILKHVRRDLISCLPLPDKLIKYLNQHNYFAEIN